MLKLKDLIDIQEHGLEDFSDCEIIYSNDWADYEECGWLIVFKFFDELMVWEYQYSVMSSDNTVYFDPYPITEEELTVLKKAWEADS